MCILSGNVVGIAQRAHKPFTVQLKSCVGLGIFLTLDFIYFTDFLRFLKSKQKKASSFQPRNNRTHVIDDELFDDASKYGKMKKVSFLETFSIHSPSEDIKASYSHECDSGDSSVNQQKKFNHSFSLQNSSDHEDEDSTFINDNGASADSKMATLDTSRSSSDPKEDTPLPLPLDDSEMEPADPEEKSSSALEESCKTPQLLASDLQDLSLAGVFPLL